MQATFERIQFRGFTFFCYHRGKKKKRKTKFSSLSFETNLLPFIHNLGNILLFKFYCNTTQYKAHYRYFPKRISFIGYEPLRPTKLIFQEGKGYYAFKPWKTFYVKPNWPLPKFWVVLESKTFYYATLYIHLV